MLCECGAKFPVMVEDNNQLLDAQQHRMKNVLKIHISNFAPLSALDLYTHSLLQINFTVSKFFGIT
jgi:hypothetical protein